MPDNDPLSHKKAACQTYIEQTKLLVTLASAFLLAPAGLVTVLKDRDAAGLGSIPVGCFIISEALFVASALFGYVVLGTITGSQDDGTYNVYRPATRNFSLLQFGTYLAGLITFVLLVLGVITP